MRGCLCLQLPCILTRLLLLLLLLSLQSVECRAPYPVPYSHHGLLRQIQCEFCSHQVMMPVARLVISLQLLSSCQQTGSGACKLGDHPQEVKEETVEWLVVVCSSKCPAAPAAGTRGAHLSDCRPPTAACRLLQVEPAVGVQLAGVWHRRRPVLCR